MESLPEQDYVDDSAAAARFPIKRRSTAHDGRGFLKLTSKSGSKSGSGSDNSKDAGGVSVVLIVVLCVVGVAMALGGVAWWRHSRGEAADEGADATDNSAGAIAGGIRRSALASDAGDWIA